MVDQSENTQNVWLAGGQQARVELDHTVSLMTKKLETDVPNLCSRSNSDGELGVIERAFSAAGAAFLSAVIVNPLDVAKESFAEVVFGKRINRLYNTKTRLQAQAAGVPYSHPLGNLTSRMAFFGPTMMFADLRCSPSCTRAGVQGTIAICPPDCFQYKGTLDVFYKIVRQEGVARLWRGTNAGLALAIPTVGIYLPCYDIFRNYLEGYLNKNIPSLTPYAPLVAGSLARSLACTICYPIELARTRMQAFKEINTGRKPPGVTKTLVEVLAQVKSTNGLNNLQNSRALWTGLGAQLARDVPYSAICWSMLEPLRRKLHSLTGDSPNVATVLAVNFSAGFVAGSIAAAATCPLDVAKTRRQIEKDPVRAWKMTTRQTLIQVYRDGGMKGLFTGVGPRVGRAGPSVGIVVSFYEVVKYALHHHYATS